MKFLKATTIEGTTEFFNIDNILTITKLENGNIKILMGAGLYWQVYANSLEVVDNLLSELNRKDLI